MERRVHEPAGLPTGAIDAERSRGPVGGSAEAWLNKGIQHLSKGRVEEALWAASSACHLAPAVPEAHYLYGQSFAALGRHAEAERAFAAAIQLAPRWADAWINYGIARYRQGSVGDAKTAMRQVLAFAPDHPVASSNLAAFLRISGEGEGGEGVLSARLHRDPQDIGARLNLAAEYLADERTAEALALLEAVAAPEDPAAYRHWQLQRALAFLQAGRPEGARAALDAMELRGPAPAALAPLIHWRLALLARAEGDHARALREAEAMEAALDAPADGPGQVPEHAIMARFDLAKFWSGQGELSRAMAQWREGHRRLGRAQPFSREAHRAFVDASIAAFPSARFARGKRASNRDEAPVFIVGMPRSGTTLIEQILDAHDSGHGAGERRALGAAFSALASGANAHEAPARIAALDADVLDAAADDYLTALHALAPQAARIVDKMPGNFNYLGLAGLLLPGARIIHCVRDPRDIGLSIFTFRFHGEHAYAHDLADLGWYIGQHDRLMAHWKAVLPNPIHTVRLADWVEDFDGTLARLLAFLDLPPDPNCARFHENAGRVRTVSRSQVRQPINARGLGRWRPYAADLAPLICELEHAGCLEGWK